MTPLWSARIAVFIHACPHGDPDTTEVRVLKGWFSKRELRTESREMFKACFPIGEAQEPERVARALEAAAAMVRQGRD